MVVNNISVIPLLGAKNDKEALAVLIEVEKQRKIDEEKNKKNQELAKLEEAKQKAEQEDVARQNLFISKYKVPAFYHLWHCLG